MLSGLVMPVLSVFGLKECAMGRRTVQAQAPMSCTHHAIAKECAMDAAEPGRARDRSSDGTQFVGSENNIVYVQLT